MEPGGQRRRTTTLYCSGTLDGPAQTFLKEIHLGTTKSGKVPQRLIDRLVAEHLAPAPTFTFSRVLNGTRIDVTKHVQGETPKVKTLGPRKSASFLKDLDGITVRGSKKRKEAESNLAASYF